MGLLELGWVVHMHVKRLYSIGVITGLSSLALLSTTLSIYYLPIMFLVGLALFIIYKRGFGGRADIIDREADMLIDAMIINYRRCKNPIELVSISIKREWRIYERVNTAIDEYKASASLDVFDRLLKDGSRKIRLIAILISRSVRDNGNFYEDLSGLAELFSKQNRYKMKSYGVVKNGSAVVNMGTMLFFPLFAGIGLNIINFAGLKLGIVYSSAVSSAVILYLLFASLINSRYSRDNIYDKLAFASFSLFVALTVFRTTSILSALMLR